MTSIYTTSTAPSNPVQNAEQAVRARMEQAAASKDMEGYAKALQEAHEIYVDMPLPTSAELDELIF